MLVEDDRVTAVAEKKALEKYGYAVYVAYTGEAAVERCRNGGDPANGNHPELILMDIDLGEGIDGTVAAEQILQHRHIPIVFLSSHTSPEIVERTEKITSYGYVVKSSSFTVVDASIKMAFKLFAAQNQLKAQKEQLRKLSQAVEQSPVSVVVTDLDGCIEYVNPRFLSLTGYSLDEIIGENPRILKTDTLSPAEYKQLWDTITSGEQWNGEFRNRKKNGELYWEKAVIAPIFDNNGYITNFLGVKETHPFKSYENPEEFVAAIHEYLVENDLYDLKKLSDWENALVNSYYYAYEQSL